MKLTGEIGTLNQRVINLSEQCKNEAKKVENLCLENQKKTHTITLLSDDINVIKDNICSLKEQNDDLTKENLHIQNKIKVYERGVLNSLEYKELKEAYNQAKERVSDLEKTLHESYNLIGLQKRTIKKLCADLRNRDRERLSEIERDYEEKAEGEDKNLSYVIIRGHSTIIASTPEFRKRFKFDADKIKGAKYFEVLKTPDDAPDYIPKLKEDFEKPEEIELTTTIKDGDDEERIIRFIKNTPICREIRGTSYYYTKVEVYNIGWVKREFGKMKRRLHIKNGEPVTILQALDNYFIDKTKKESEEEKNRILSRKPIKKSLLGWLKRKETDEERIEKQRLISNIIYGVISYKEAQEF